VDVTLYREGLVQVLARNTMVDVVGSAAGGEDAVKDIELLRPDVVLLDAGMKNGLLALSELRVLRSRPKLIALALSEAEADVIAWAEAGVCAYLTREASLSDLVTTIALAMRGESVCSPTVTASLMERLAARANHDGDKAALARLTSREMDIAQLIARGLSNKEIARALSIAIPTVKNHVHNILEKMHVNRRTQAALFVRNESVAFESVTSVAATEIR
jgi:two-component system, NarL family, nitrate/nitrite response regulator NarL